MKFVKFTATLPETSGIMEYDNEEYDDAVSSGEIHYHGLDFLSIDENIQLRHELVSEND